MLVRNYIGAQENKTKSQKAVNVIEILNYGVTEPHIF